MWACGARLTPLGRAQPQRGNSGSGAGQELGEYPAPIKPLSFSLPSCYHQKIRSFPYFMWCGAIWGLLIMTMVNRDLDTSFWLCQAMPLGTGSRTRALLTVRGR